MKATENHGEFFSVDPSNVIREHRIVALYSYWYAQNMTRECTLNGQRKVACDIDQWQTYNISQHCEVALCARKGFISILY